MIGKVSLGSNIANALAYGAGELNPRQKEQKSKQAELLQTFNLGHTSWQGMAQEMEVVAQGSHCKTPLWHTSLALKPDEQLSSDQWRQAAYHYCQTIGADVERHQIAVFQHHDTAHSHIHIYINRVPIDQGPALSKRHEYNTSRYAVRRVEEQLGLSRAERLSNQGLAKHPKRALQPGAEFIQAAIAQTLQDDKPTHCDDFVVALAKRGVQATIEQKKSGQWGTQFQYTAPGQRPTKVSGGDLGYKYNQLVSQLEANRVEPEVAKKVTKPARKSKKRSLAAKIARALESSSQSLSTEPQQPNVVAKLLTLIQSENTNQAIKPAKSIQAPSQGAQGDDLTDSSTAAKPVKPPKVDSVPAGLKTIGGVLTTPAQQAELMAGKAVHVKGLLYDDGKPYDCVVTFDRSTNKITAIKEQYIRPATPVAAPSIIAAPPKLVPQPTLPTPSVINTSTQTVIAIFRETCREHYKFDLTKEQITSLMATERVELPKISMRVWVDGGKMAFELIRVAQKPASAPGISSATPSNSTGMPPVAKGTGTPPTAKPLPAPPATMIKPPVVAPADRPVIEVTPPTEPAFFEAFRDHVRQKKAYMGTDDFISYVNNPRRKGLHLTLHKQNDELFLTDEKNNTASFKDLGLNAKALGFSQIDINHIKSLEHARKQGQGPRQKR